MAVMKTPGVYIVENNAFPNSVVQVETAVPAFIGYTETAMNGNTPLTNDPFMISSMSDYERYFGGAPKPVFALKNFTERAEPRPYAEDAELSLKAEMPQAVFTTKGPTGPEKYELVQTNPAFALYTAMKLFFANGGGKCYVTSIGSYDVADFDKDAMVRAILRLKKEPEPTMLVIPETTRMTRQDAAAVQGAMLSHCGNDMKNRFAILDIHGGYLNENERGEPIERFRYDIGANFLDYAAAYYPWLSSAIYSGRSFTFENIELTSRNKLISLLKRSVKMDPKIVPEILKVGTPELSGDFMISVEKGGTSVLAPVDISAADDSSGADRLTYQVLAEKDKVPGLFKVDTAAISEEDLLAGKMTFTQQQIVDGKVSFKHDATKAATGQFDVVVTDEEGVQTGKKTVKIVTGAKVLALPDVLAAKQVEIDLAEPGATANSVMLIGADEIDAVAVAKADKTVQAAQAALDKADDKGKAAAQKALADATATAIANVKGKTVTQGSIGIWQVTGNKVTFTPDTAFAGNEASLQYNIALGNVVALREVNVLVDGVPEKKKTPDATTKTIDQTMRALAPLYEDVMNCISKYMNAMPPGAAMAGIYTMVDNNRGVWKAPANVSVASVASPMVNISHEQQADLNVSTTGKSINAIRPFVGEGTLVWGARTLDGNSLDWRYINVRRTMIMIEESIRLAAKAYVFEPNTANTWVTIRSMIENFLTGVWKAGGIAGAVPEHAFSVHCGLGDTMTAVDILEGKLLISVFVAVTRPAEFIEITFTQKMQES